MNELESSLNDPITGISNLSLITLTKSLNDTSLVLSLSK